MKLLNYLTLAGAILSTALANAHAQPVITKQPTDQSVSLGAAVQFLVSAASTNPPILIQWQFASTNLPTETNESLTLTNIQVINAGDYHAVLTDGSGSVTSRVAHLEVDPTFTQITTGSIVTEAGTATACAWGDYNNDGFIDLVMSSAWNTQNGTAQKNRLFQNKGDGTFTKVTNTVVTSEARDWRGCSWVDYDNDGYLDLLLTSTDGDGFAAQNELFRNNGDGTFTNMAAPIVGPISATAAGESEGAIWADYDRDGFVDCYIARYGPDWLFRNNGDGTFTKMTNVIVGLLQDNSDSYNAMWGDYDNDGWPDLYVAVKSDTGGNQRNFFYHNLGNGTFSRIITGKIANDLEHSMSCAWVDYDNDGNLDLFVVNGNLGVLQTNSLYHNNGDGAFTKMTAATVGDIVADKSHCVHCAWGDYDNDGYLDVYVTNPGDTQNNFQGEANFLYHNNGNGTFTRVLTGSPANDVGNSVGCAWGDYDNDGFLDLVVARGTDIRPQTSLLYRNNGNSNTWLKIKLVGTVSNRSAVGAKVRVKATIAGRSFWQLREINTGQGFAGGDLIAHFGLGDATNAATVRIEWPSGFVQELYDVPSRQVLTVTEPPRLSVRVTDGAPLVLLKGGRGLRYRIERSMDLVAWSPIGSLVITNISGMAQITDTNPVSSTQAFYRTALP